MNLAVYAAKSETTRGRQHKETSPAYRSEYQRDRDRVIHSAAFRRLEYKTQVFVNHEGDLFRTRLTHSIEVAQISRSVARALHLNEDLSEAISLAHDLGHTPFGHTGQDVLNECMRDYGGFEHNLQSLRVVDVLEERYAEFLGLNLTFEAREGILKHCSTKKAAELGDIGQRFLDKNQPGLEAQLVNLADELAYTNHDVDDGLRYGLIQLDQLVGIELFALQYAEVKDRYPGLSERRQIHETIRRMINYTVVDLIEHSQRLLADNKPSDIDAVRKHPSLLIAFSKQVGEEILAMKRFLRHILYTHEQVKRMSRQAAAIIQHLFSIFMNDPSQLPSQYQDKIHRRDDDRARIVADYIAGMTDRYAIREHGRFAKPVDLA